MSKIYTDLNAVLTPYATAIKKNASDITSLNGSLGEKINGEDVTGTFVNKKYLVTNPDTVTQVDITNETSGNNWSYKILDVTPGEKYLLTLYGGVAARAWCITDSSYNIITASKKSAVLENEIVKIPPNGTHMILGHRTDMGVTASVVKGIPLDIVKDRVYHLHLSEEFKKSFSDILDILAYSSEEAKEKVQILKNSLAGAIYHSAQTVAVNYITANVSYSNKNLETEIGSAFSTTLSIDTGSTLYEVSVKMGEVDITSGSYNASTHVISISSVTDVITITALASSDYEKDSEYIYSDIDVVPNGADYDSTYGGYYLNTSNGYQRREIVSKIPFGKVMPYWNASHVPTGAVSDYYLIKVPTDATGVLVESEPDGTQLIAAIHPMDENGAFTSRIAGGGSWGGSTVSLNFDAATLEALSQYGLGMNVIARYGNNVNYDNNPQYIPKVKISFMK